MEKKPTKKKITNKVNATSTHTNFNLRKKNKDDDEYKFEIEILIKMFQENYLHLRHVENERLQVCLACTAVLGASIGLSFKTVNLEMDGDFKCRMIFLMALVLIFILISLNLTIKWNRNFEARQRSIHFCYNKVKEIYTNTSKDNILDFEQMFPLRKIIPNSLRTGILFVGMYLVFIIIVISTIVWELRDRITIETFCNVIVLMMIAIVFALISNIIKILQN